MKTKERLCSKIVLCIFSLLVLCRTAGAQDARKGILSAADAGTCTTDSTACLFLAIPSGSGGATFTITANASGNTIQFEATGDTEPRGSHTWVALSVFPSNATTSVTSTTSTGTWQANVAGFTQVRLRMSTFVGGTTTTYINLSTASARSGGGGGGSVTHTAGNLTAFHIMIGNGAADATVDSACVTNGTGALSGCTSISAGSGASSAGATATGGFAAAEAASTGWTSTVGQNYIRADLTHAWFCGMNGVAEPGCTFGALTAPTFTSNGTTAGFIDFPQGSDSGAVAPCNAATSICWEAPTSVTSYKGILPGAAATGIPHYANSANVITETISAINLAGADVTGALPIGNVGSAGLSGTSPVAIASTGAISCATCVVNNGTNIGTTAMTLDMSASTTASALKIPVGAGLTSAANGVIAYDTTAGATHVRSNAADSLAVAEAAAIVANTVPKATNSTNSLITASSMIDNGTNVTSTDTGGFVAPVFVSNGSTAGFVDYPQGSTSAAVAPCNVATSICEQAPTAVTSYLVTKPGVSATGITTNNVSAAVITQGISGDANHSATVTTGSGTSIGSTTLCSSTNCPAGTYVVHTYIDITTACGTTGTYVVNLIYTDDQGAKTIPVNLNGTGAVPATGVLTTTSTANFGESSQVLRLTSGNLNYSTTAVACGTAGPMVGKLYMAAVPVM